MEKDGNNHPEGEKYMELRTALEALRKLQKTRHAYAHAQGLLFFDGATVAPKASMTARSATLGVLSQKAYRLFVNEDTRHLLDELKSREGELTQSQARQVELLMEELDQLTRIPIEEYVAYTELVNESLAVWEDAKKRDDFLLFQPYLEKVVDFTKRFARYKDAHKPLYDLMLDDYEKGIDQGILDPFFEALRRDIIPVLDQVRDLPVEDSFLRGSFPIDVQERLAHRLMSILGLDSQYFMLATMEHPFTVGMHRTDVRIATHYYENEMASSPSYALGSAYSAQILNAMERDLPVEALTERGELAPVTQWLRERIHQHGKLYKPGSLLERVCGEPFSAKYYVAYLTRKMKDVCM